MKAAHGNVFAKAGVDSTKSAMASDMKLFTVDLHRQRKNSPHCSLLCGPEP
jgi:hypothetical protein